jgi:arylsulfatase A-like enzyme
MMLPLIPRPATRRRARWLDHASSGRAGSRRGWRLLSAIIVVYGLGAVGPVAAAESVNVLLLVSDDQRPDTIACLGNQWIRTPALDQLCQRGTVFTRAITAIPICVASRAELLTGRDGRTNGKSDFGFSPKAGVKHLATALHDAGYETCYVGKWHTSGRPSTHGYETTQGLFSAGAGNLPLTVPVDWKGMAVTGYRGWVFQTDDKKILPQRGIGLTPNISELFTDDALSFLDRRSDRPFFLQVNYTAPHDPLLIPKGDESRVSQLQVPLPKNFAPRHPFDHGNANGRDELLFSSPRTPEQTRAALAVYYAVIEHLDAQVGRLLDGLRERGLLEKTLIIYTSDHGLAMGSHGLRGKQNMYEHTIGVPLIFSGPGIPVNRRTDAQCYLRDLYPTICDFVGVPVPPTVQGRSLVPILNGTKSEIYDLVAASFRDSQLMVRTRDWKYIRYPLADREQLFFLPDDPEELHDLSGDEKSLSALLKLREAARSIAAMQTAN